MACFGMARQERIVEVGRGEARQRMVCFGMEWQERYGGSRYGA
jgi:hypothetical protein